MILSYYISSFLFPFLQGRLRTGIELWVTGAWKAFPFLQGRLRTLKLYTANRGSNSFPFLQGRLRTGWRHMRPIIYLTVSIPSRQASYRTRPKRKAARSQRFHSFKVGFVRGIIQEHGKKHDPFPFLQGRLRTNRKRNGRIGSFKFPFLQGRLRTWEEHEEERWSSQFPFLQGRLRTEVNKSNPKFKLRFHSFKVGFVLKQNKLLLQMLTCFHSFKVGFVLAFRRAQSGGKPRFHSFKVGFVPVNTASILSLIFRVVKGFFRAFLTKFR